MNKCFSCDACLVCETKKGHCQCKKLSTDSDNEMITFGKHKGMSFKDMKELYPDYMLWVMSSIPKHKIDDKLYNYIYVNRDDLSRNASKKRRV